MGCLKLPYYEKEDRPNFLGLWKKSAGSKNCDNYYPFGLAFNSYQRENTTKNKFKFQGQEHIEDLDLGWDSFKWRNHMPEIGRFFNVDPLSEKYYYNSVYAFSENKVVAHIELEGLESVPAGKGSGSRGADYYNDKTKVISPVANPVISSEFGGRDAPVANASTNHKGIDIVQADRSSTSGTDVVSPVNGSIVSITGKEDGNGAGNRVSIKGNDGNVHKMFHLQDGFADGLQAGQDIERGTKVGEIGVTGNVSGPHLHYEVRKDGEALDPRTGNPGLTDAPTRAQSDAATRATNTTNTTTNTNNSTRRNAPYDVPLF
jgi:RHS repeat-associated protein